MISSQINKEFIELRCLYPYLLDLNSESPRLDSNQRPVDYMSTALTLLSHGGLSYISNMTKCILNHYSYIKR